MMEVVPQLLGADNPHDSSERVERLNYLADMLSELQEIASREGCLTLAGLLALAHVEAQRQAVGSLKSRT